MLEREIIITNDGSSTIHIPEWNEQYHSKHGAIQESKHVFIEKGLYYYLHNNKTSALNILEIGFGTGLNAIITLFESNRLQQSIHYTGVEAYPVEMSEIKKLNYSVQLNCSKKDYHSLHQSPWEEKYSCNDYFSIEKRKQFFSETLIMLRLRASTYLTRKDLGCFLSLLKIHKVPFVFVTKIILILTVIHKFQSWVVFWFSSGDPCF